MFCRTCSDSCGSDSAIVSSGFRRVALLLHVRLFQHICYCQFGEQSDQSIHHFLPLHNDRLGAPFAYLYAYSAFRFVVFLWGKTNALDQIDQDRRVVLFESRLAQRADRGSSEPGFDLLNDALRRLLEGL